MADGESRTVLGSPEWLDQTNGVLTRRQRLTLTGRVAAQLPIYIGHRTRAAWWRRRTSKGTINFDWETTPATLLAERAENACHSSLRQSAMVNRSYRTWAFGLALAERDGQKLDRELFFVASMLHDIGLGHLEFGTCFTRSGTRLVQEIGRELGRSRDELVVAASAISHHITPGLRTRHGGPHALYLQHGSVLDLGGLRVIHLPVDFVRAVCERWPTGGVNREAGARWRAEAAMVKHGRAHHLQRWSRFSCVSRFTPIPP